MASSLPSWGDLLPELLGRVIARLPFPDDRARFRAVCRSWHLAVRQHVRPELPWILHSDGTFVTLPDRGYHSRLPFPDNTRFIGAINSWLALYRTDAKNGQRSYLLHNPFSKTTVPLPGLDSIIGKVSNLFEVRKVLMRSTQDDLVVVTTNNWNYPIILCRPGKSGTWLPKRREMPYACIFDVVFHRGSLYGITAHEDLVLLGLDEDDDGIPTVTSVEYVIKHMRGDEDEDEEENEDDEEVSSNEDEEEVEYNEASSLVEEDEELEYNEALSVLDESDDNKAILNRLEDKDNGFSGNGHGEVSSNKDEEEVEDEEYNEALSVLDESDDDKAILNNSDKHYDGDWMVPNGREVDEVGECDTNGARDYIATERRLLESNGKLLMVRRQQYIPRFTYGYNIKVEVLEADVDMGAWVPVTADGISALFISDLFSKSVSMPRKAGDELICYFVDEHDVIDSKSKTLRDLLETKSTWVFPRELVV